MNDLNDRILAVQKAFAEFMKQAKLEFPAVMQAYINENMHTRPANPAAFNLTDKLYTRSGSLVRSFIPGQKGNVFIVKTATDTALQVEYGTALPYAAIHEKGGVITATPKMIAYFWAMHYKTQLNFFKVLALAAKKNGAMKIKPRPYFAPAVKKYEKDGIAFIERNLFTTVERAWNGR
jgi:phage gpG-like protein